MHIAIRVAILCAWSGLATLSAQAQDSSSPVSETHAIEEHPTTLPYRPDAIPIDQYSSVSMAQRLITDPRSDGKDRYLAIYSGSTAGVYYQIGSALCSVMERTIAQHGIRCATLRSGGVSSNTQLMREGRAQAIIVQSDTNFLAQMGIAEIPGARSLISLHNEMGVMVVRTDSGITGPKDLIGKRINLGPRGSASSALWRTYLSALGIGEEDFDEVYAIQQDLNREALCDGIIDVFGLWIGHPAPVIDGVLANCDARLVGMWDDRLLPLLETHKYFFRQSLPADTYAGQDKTLDSFGIKASLVAYEPLDEDIAYWLVRMVAENMTFFRAQHPALANLQIDEMFTDGNFLPFHKGAARYWREHQFGAATKTDDPAPHQTPE